MSDFDQTFCLLGLSVTGVRHYTEADKEVTLLRSAKKSAVLSLATTPSDASEAALTPRSYVPNRHSPYVTDALGIMLYKANRVRSSQIEVFLGPSVVIIYNVKTSLVWPAV